MYAFFHRNRQIQLQKTKGNYYCISVPTMNATKAIKLQIKETISNLVMHMKPIYRQAH